MIQTGIKNLTIQKNRDFEVSFRFPYSIANLTFASEIRDTANNLIATFTIEKDTDNNIVYLRLINAQTALLSNNMLYDLKQTDLTGFDKSIVKGSIIVEASITQ